MSERHEWPHNEIKRRAKDDDDYVDDTHRERLLLNTAVSANMVIYDSLTDKLPFSGKS